MSRFFQLMDISDVETIRNSFGEKYKFLETISIKTSSPTLKNIALNTMNSLCTDYCKLLKIESIPDLRELVAYTQSTFELNVIVQNPDFALAFFGLHFESSPNELALLYEKVKSELELEMEGFHLESSKTPVMIELDSIEVAFQTGMKLLVHDAMNRSVEDLGQTEQRNLNPLILTGVLLVLVLIVLILVFKK